VVALVIINKFLPNLLQNMKIHNLKEYLIAIEKAAFFIDNGFGGSFEKEKYYRELLRAIKEYDEQNPLQLNTLRMVDTGA
jgi:hypothetical protein